jgi:CRP-like cAMP-binding protein
MATIIGQGYQEKGGKAFCKKGDALFQEGEKGTQAFLIERGSVEISKTIDGKKTVLEVLNAGGMFGELAIIDQKPRAATAIALDDTVCTIIDSRQINDILARAEPAMKVLVKVLMSIIRKSQPKGEA